MSLLFMEGFDNMSVADVNNYVVFSAANSTTSDRFSGRAVVLYYANQRPIFALPATSTTEGVIGFAWQRTTLGETIDICRSKRIDGGYLIMEIGITSSNLMRVRQNSVLRCTANPAYSLQINTWYYIEVEYKFHTSDGYINLYQDGVLVANYSGATPGYNNYTTYDCVEFLHGHASSTRVFHFDDIYVLNTLGDINNSRLGEINVVGLQPNAVGTTTDWTAFPVEDYNYENVDETYQDGDTTYNYTVTSGDIDTFGIEPITTFSGGVAAIKIRHYSRKTDVGTRALRQVITYSGVDRFGDNSFPQSVGYTWQEEIYEYVPVLSGIADTEWTVDKVNDSEYGYEVHQ